MTRKLEDYLAEELDRTGYPLEIEISSILDEKYIVSNNAYFFDWKENKAREVDISAFPKQREYEKETKITPFALVHRLIIECKRSNTHAWIFLTRPRRIFWFEGQCMSFENIVTKDARMCFLHTVLAKCGCSLHYDSFKRVASIYAEIKYQGQRSQKSEIFEAKNQIVKYIDYSIVQFLERLKNRGFNPSTNHLIWLYHPVILFDGKMYEAIMKNGSIQLFERKHLLLSARYSPSYVKDFPNTESPGLPYLIDVVRNDYFGDFLSILEEEYSTLWKCIFSNNKELSKEAKEICTAWKVLA